MAFLSQAATRLGVAKHVYVVGGAVRNFVIDQPIKDIDVVIDSVALKGKDSEWFAKQLQQGIPVRTSLATNQYGVAILTVVGDWELDGHSMKGEVLEIANAREETYGAGGKGYKPSDVKPASIEADVYRREFTFNTLMWRLADLANGPDKAEILDITGCGLADLKAGVMACPSDPDKTFSDDPSRMLRAIKFLVRYGFEIKGEVADSIRRNAQALMNAPQEAIAQLLVTDILQDKTSGKALKAMKSLGLLDVIAEMLKTNQAFASTMANWSNDKNVAHLFDMIDHGLPLTTPLSFLEPDERDKLREIAAVLPSADASRLLAALKQPGKALADKNFIPQLAAERGIAKNAMGDFAKKIGVVVRAALLNNPDLIRQPDVLKNLTRTATENVAMESKTAEQYKTLKDAAVIDKRYGAGSTSIWFSKTPSFKAVPFDVDLTRLNKTHVLVGTIKSKDLDEVWGMMQGDFWSPEGQANTMINKLGLRHTSMSVGDIIAIDDQMGDTHMVTGAGFLKLSPRADESKATGGTYFPKEIGVKLHNWHAGQGDAIYRVGSEIYAGHAVTLRELDRVIPVLERLVGQLKRDHISRGTDNEDDIEELESLIGTLTNDGEPEEPEEVEESKSDLGTAVAHLRSVVRATVQEEDTSELALYQLDVAGKHLDAADKVLVALGDALESDEASEDALPMIDDALNKLVKVRSVLSRTRSKIGAIGASRRGKSATKSDLQRSDLKRGLEIEQIAHPEYGVWFVVSENPPGTWEVSRVRKASDSMAVAESELLRFWRKAHYWPK